MSPKGAQARVSPSRRNSELDGTPPSRADAWMAKRCRSDSRVCRPTVILPIITTMSPAAPEPAMPASDKTMTMDVSQR